MRFSRMGEIISSAKVLATFIFAIRSASSRMTFSTVILAHNHPNGTALPSDADILMTRQLYEMARIMEIDLQDHIIVAGDDFVSLAQTGILSGNIY